MNREYMLSTTMKTSIPYPVSRSTSLPKPRAQIEGEIGFFVEEPYSVTAISYDKYSSHPPERDLRTFVKVIMLGKGSYFYFSRAVGDRA